MSSNRRPSLTSLPHSLRAFLEHLPDRWNAWREGFRADPTLFWRTPVVRITGLILIGVAAVVALTWLAGLLAPAESGPGTRQATPWATLYVACTNPACRAHYTTQQPMDFDDWPLRCEKCEQDTVYRATRCKACRRWFATAPGQPATCPFCAKLKAAQRPVEPLSRPPAAGDDSEDPW